METSTSGINHLASWDWNEAQPRKPSGQQGGQGHLDALLVAQLRAQAWLP